MTAPQAISASLHAVSGTSSLTRNLDVGEILRLRGLLGEADRLVALLLPLAQTSILRLPGYERTIEDARNYIHQ